MAHEARLRRSARVVDVYIPGVTGQAAVPPGENRQSGGKTARSRGGSEQAIAQDAVGARFRRPRAEGRAQAARLEARSGARAAGEGRVIAPGSFTVVTSLPLSDGCSACDALHGQGRPPHVTNAPR